ncbi:MAG: hypothetical protein B7Z09_00075 [Brevundimonas diminuta]|jgi:predicted MFS family arabinose efflux permease|nr:MAG: hypothetical protein B7Z09_00075 [Brevundimonas diminuta]
MTASNPARLGQTRTTTAAWLALLLLTLVNAFSLIDRKLPFIMLESIRAEFVLTDTQVGLLGGVMFTVIYSLLGLPLARLADRTSRKLVVSGALAFWSLMTAAGALSQNFVHLALARVGLAVGEAGAVPPSQAILADYFPLRRRGLAMAVFQAGGAIGVMGGLALGGRLVESLGWRETLLLAGGAGLALTAAMLIVLREPKRGQSEDAVEAEDAVTLWQALVALWRLKTFKWLAVGGALFTLGTSAIITFGPSYLVRVRGFSIADAGAYIGVVTGLAAGAGVLVGGWISSWNSPRRTLILAALGLVVSAPCLYFALNTDSRVGLLLLLAAPLFLGSLYMGPSYAFAQTMAPVHMRALTASVMVFIIHGLGTSLGPLCVGAVSDALAPSRGVDGLRLALLIAPIAYVAAAAAIIAAAHRVEVDLPGGNRVKAAR